MMQDKTRVSVIQVGPGGTNCYLIGNAETGEAICVDPGDDGDRIAAELGRNRFTLKAILLTHGHFDHILGISKLKEIAGDAPVYAAREEKECLNHNTINLSGYGDPRIYTLEADHYLDDGQELSLIGRRIVCLLTPGHTAGGMCYYFPEAGFVASGDTLFRGTVGRTDLPSADDRAIVPAIREKLMTLPDDTVVYPGHGPATTIREEKNGNPYLR